MLIAYSVLKFDVEYNCWGQNFNPSNDLKLNSGVFKPYPTWCPPNNGTLPVDQDEAMYNMAVNDVDSSNYTEAMNLFQLLVETYPKSDYAKASMKAMFETESYAGNNFSDLKVFYLTNDSILADSSLTQLGDFLANRCNVRMENYPDAISWYEDKIQSPEMEADSIFAIIDLGDIYLHMDTTGNRPVFIGSLPRYKPETKAKYRLYRDSLISLLPLQKSIDPLKKGLSHLTAGQLLQNVPNPSNSSTDIYFKLINAKEAMIKIYDGWGRLNKQIPIPEIMDGIQKTTVNTSNMPSGLYEYSLSVNGQITDTKRMVVIR